MICVGHSLDPFTEVERLSGSENLYPAKLQEIYNMWRHKHEVTTDCK
jgi:hypothetical protein